MILCSETHNISVHCWQNEEEMKNFLSGCSKGCLRLGKDAEQIRGFYSIRIDDNRNDMYGFGIGIYSEGHGLEPHLLLQSETDTLIIGFNSDVVGVDMTKGVTAFEIRLNSLFRTFIPLRSFNIILVFHEIGAIGINKEGNKIWSFEEDIIEHYSIDNDKLSFQFMDAPPATVSILEGIPKHAIHQLLS